MIDRKIAFQFRNDAQGLAEYFIQEYYQQRELRFPLNPFQVLTDLGIHFVFRDMKKLEGLYFPAVEDSPIHLVAINVNRPITRQRFTAAHELCHFLKDADGTSSSFICSIQSGRGIERYADAFASAFLMPRAELRRIVDQREKEYKQLTLEDVLRIAEHFGVSFQACFYRIRSVFPHLLPELSKSQFRKFQPDKIRKTLGLDDTGLLADMFDAWEDVGLNFSSDFARQVFKNRYIWNDARMEGVDTSSEAVAEIVEDLRNQRQLSMYCTQEYDAYCHVAGHAAMYDYMFDHALTEKSSVFCSVKLNALLFSCFPNPEYGGRTRRDNVLVLGAKFETVDWHDIVPRMNELNRKVIALDQNAADMTRSAIMREIAEIHHSLTVIHPFPDGNGRTSRAFMNQLLLRYGMPPIYIKLDRKAEYYAALESADRNRNCNDLYEMIMKSIIYAHVELAIQS